MDDAFFPALEAELQRQLNYFKYLKQRNMERRMMRGEVPVAQHSTDGSGQREASADGTTAGGAAAGPLGFLRRVVAAGLLDGSLTLPVGVTVLHKQLQDSTMGHAYERALSHAAIDIERVVEEIGSGDAAAIAISWDDMRGVRRLFVDRIVNRAALTSIAGDVRLRPRPPPPPFPSDSVPGAMPPTAPAVRPADVTARMPFSDVRMAQAPPQFGAQQPMPHAGMQAVPGPMIDEMQFAMPRAAPVSPHSFADTRSESNHKRGAGHEDDLDALLDFQSVQDRQRRKQYVRPS